MGQNETKSHSHKTGPLRPSHLRRRQSSSSHFRNSSICSCNPLKPKSSKSANSPILADFDYALPTTYTKSIFAPPIFCPLSHFPTLTLSPRLTPRFLWIRPAQSASPLYPSRGGDSLKAELSAHVRQEMDRRGIPLAVVESVLTAPAQKVPEHGDVICY